MLARPNATVRTCPRILNWCSLTGQFCCRGRALVGTRGHQRLQKSRPDGYQKEVAVSYEVETDDLVLRIQGRIDGLMVTPGETTVEEIKTVQGHWDGLADPLHW